MGELKNTFRPEFLNRIDDIIVFDRLGEKEIEQIAGKLVETLKERIASLGIDIDFTDAVIKKVSKAGFDEVYGARPLKRAIQSELEDLISEEMLKGNIVKGEKYICKIEKNKIVFKKQK